MSTVAYSITIDGNWTKNVENVGFNAGTGLVMLVRAFTFTVSGNNTFYNLTCTVPGATIKFQDGKNTDHCLGRRFHDGGSGLHYSNFICAASPATK